MRVVVCESVWVCQCVWVCIGYTHVCVCVRVVACECVMRHVKQRNNQNIQKKKKQIKNVLVCTEKVSHMTLRRGIIKNYKKDKMLLFL